MDYTPKWEVLLFAEDIVSYLMNAKHIWQFTQFRSSKAAPRAGGLRKFLYNGFNDDVKKAVYVLYDSLSDYIDSQYNRMMSTSHISDECLQKYAKLLWEDKFSDAMDGISFLRYCVVITGLAGMLYSQGTKKALDYAVRIILYHFPPADCLKVTWDVLHIAARNFLKEKLKGESHSQFLDGSDNYPSLKTDCNCFKTDIKGRSFKKIYAIRSRVLKNHFFICLNGKFEEDYKQNFIMKTDDHQTDDSTYVSSGELNIPDIYMDDRCFPREQSNMSAILKTSEAARNSERSSHNIPELNIPDINMDDRCFPREQSNMSALLKISEAAKNSERSSANIPELNIRDIYMDDRGFPREQSNMSALKIFEAARNSDNIPELNITDIDMDDRYFPKEQSNMSALLKISQAARNSERSSDNIPELNITDTDMDGRYFPKEQSNMSALLKISQAARNSERSSDNRDYTTLGNPENGIHNKHTDKSGVNKTSPSVELSEKPSSSGTFLSSTVPKETNHDADSFIFKIPQSVKRFKLSDNDNGDKNDKVVPRQSVIVRNLINESELLISKLSEMVKNTR